MPPSQIQQQIQAHLSKVNQLEQKALMAERVQEAHTARPQSREYQAAKSTSEGLRKDIQRLLISVDGLRSMLPAETTAIAA